MTFTVKCMEQEDNTMPDTTQAQKDKCYKCSIIYGS